MWFELFVFGTIWWWILTLITIGILIWEVAEDFFGKGIFTIFLYILLIHLFGDCSLFSTVTNNPQYIYAGLPLYFVGGTIFSLCKWFLFVKHHSVKYKKERKRFLLAHGINNATTETKIPNDLISNWSNRSLLKPSVNEHKNTILTWMCFWPLSLVWTIIHEPWEHIYNFFSTLYQRITDYVFRKVGFDEDMRDV